MTNDSKKHRIIFIDLMRAFAVLMMVQGHTVDVLLSDSFRNFDSPFFSAWHFMRGLTAPIFMFTAGTVFTYLFRLVDEPFKSNPRVKKGIKRFLLLVGLGYILRYPTAAIVDFSFVTDEQWKIFFAVDVLQLIGFGVLFLLISLFLAEKLKIHDYVLFSIAGLIFFALSPVLNNIEWKTILPTPFAGYFYTGTGSNFPLFPWAGYVISGGLLGSYLAKNPMAFRSVKFSLRLLLFSAIFLVIALLAFGLEQMFYQGPELLSTAPSVIILRIGLVLFLNSIVSLFALRITSIPKAIVLIGRNTLLIYVVHLMILYGSAWNPGLIALFARSFDVWKTLGSALLMFITMTGMVVVIHRLRIKYKGVVT
jgi:uncharacterized membrane protein